MDKIFSPIKRRIFHFIKEMGIGKEKFFKATGISASNFKGIGAKSELGGDKIVKILHQYPSLSADWLLTGAGEMIKGKEAPAPSLTIEDNSGEALQKKVTLLEKKLSGVEISLKQMEYTQKSMHELQTSILSLLRLPNPPSGAPPAPKASDNNDSNSGGSQVIKTSRRKREQNN